MSTDARDDRSGRDDRDALKYQRIANQLRMEISDGVYAVGDRMPTQEELVARFDVSRATVVHALDDLRKQGWIKTRKGSGSTAARPDTGDRPFDVADTSSPMAALRPHLTAAFREEHVTIDVFSLTAETMSRHISAQVLDVEAGVSRPRSIRLRLMLPAPDIQLALPRAKDDPSDERPLQRHRALTVRHVGTLRDDLYRLRTVGLVPEVSVEIRSVPLTPSSKLYLLNGREALYGMYQPVERSVTMPDGETVTILDALGVGARLFRDVKDDRRPNSRASLHVAELQQWFDNWWQALAREESYGN
ncbi:GntR family transcriptional regulator [Streptomyces sp. NPDC048845]|uniref:GntR family transcriptional regulator n=1 Tax=Streptomyces sp. NPDC048845 TaxID=3155390 RepID=UPI00341D9B33